MGVRVEIRWENGLCPDGMWAKEAVDFVLLDLSLPGACIGAMSFDLVKSYGNVSAGIFNVMPSLEGGEATPR